VPVVRLHYPKGALSPERKKELAASLTEIVLDVEVDAITLPGRMVTVIHFDEVAPENWAVGGQLASGMEHFIVDVYVLAGRVEGPRRGAMHARIAAAFAKTFGDESMVARVWVLLHEVPEGSWGATGRTVSAIEVAQVINADLDPARAASIEAFVARQRT
jgi:phenylpyruvate tautomerase PptA (4-oxalocrotonate tautomerase family)